ncbi:hypothetical protein QJS66_12380 [Kocuria rhizophila]|nr:hypothetical protein QJS66_12380 [Kocuria rhizophila]
MVALTIASTCWWAGCSWPCWAAGLGAAAPRPGPCGPWPPVWWPPWRGCHLSRAGQRPSTSDWLHSAVSIRGGVAGDRPTPPRISEEWNRRVQESKA